MRGFAVMRAVDVMFSLFNLHPRRLPWLVDESRVALVHQGRIEIQQWAKECKINIKSL